MPAELKPVILIVENEEETRRLYTDLLASIDAHLLEAGNAYEAFDRLRQEPVSLILTDLGMPGGVLEYLANLRHTAKSCPILAITGLEPGLLRQQALAAGATLFIEKPVRSKQLREVVSRCLRPYP